MSVKVNNNVYKSAQAALKANAEALAAGSKIRVEDEMIYYIRDGNQYEKSVKLANGKYMAITYSFASIRKFFQQIGMKLTRDIEIVDDDVIIDVDDNTKITRYISTANKQVIEEEALTSKFVGEYKGSLNRYDIHHIIAFKNAEDIDGYIHNTDNLIALNKFYHDIMHHGTYEQVVETLSDIFSAYPSKRKFMMEQELNIDDVAKMSLATHQK
jgi:hypothetical protein